MSSSLQDSNTSHVLTMLRSGFPPSTPLKALQTVGEPTSKTYCAHIAAEKGLLPVIRFLADTSPSVFEAKNSSGLTPFLCACKSCEFDTVRFLATRAKVDLSVTDPKGNTAVHLSASEGYKDLVQYLVEDLGLSPLLRNHDGELPVDVCSRSGLKGDIYKQAAREETGVYLMTKFGIPPPPDLGKEGKRLVGQGRNKGSLTPINRGDYGGENLRLNLRSLTPVDRMIRERCKVVYSTVQSRMMQKGPALRRSRPSHSLNSRLLRMQGFSPGRGLDGVMLE